MGAALSCVSVAGICAMGCASSPVPAFSAAMNNAAQFRTMTAATVVGGPIGEKPNSYQEVREMTLPNSHLIVRYSTRWYAFVDSGPNVIEPDVRIAPSWADYAAGRDPVLAYALDGTR